MSSKSKKNRKPYRPPAEVPAALAAKKKSDQANAYVKTAGRMGRLANRDARKEAHQVGIQGEDAAE